jgi:hypothetical protein
MKEDWLKENYKILEHYGFDNQAIIWIEELSELTKEITKRLRKGCFTEESLKNTKFEITDVQVSLDQIKKAIGYTLEEQEQDYKFKVERTLEIIESEDK